MLQNFNSLSVLRCLLQPKKITVYFFFLFQELSLHFYPTCVQIRVFGDILNVDGFFFCNKTHPCLHGNIFHNPLKNEEHKISWIFFCWFKKNRNPLMIGWRWSNSSSNEGTEDNISCFLDYHNSAKTRLFLQIKARYSNNVSSTSHS